jgi:hypothetical protein
MSKQLTNDVSARVESFLSLLRSATLEKPVPIKEFQAIVEKEYVGTNGGNVDAEAVAAAIERKVRYALKLAETHLGGGRLIVREGNHIRVTALRATGFDRRCQREVQVKTVVAQALLHWLFGEVNFPSQGVKQYKSFELICKSAALKKRIESKLEHLRRTSVLSMIIDAGSTTFKVMELFLKAKEMPLTVTVHRRHDETGRPLKETTQRLVTPLVITNSIPIAAAIGSSHHHSVITLKLIGGTEVTERRSICGEGAILWLKTCQASGVMASADLAIIGTTGYMEHFVGAKPALGCHDASEANLKAEMLQLAEHGLRVCILDSRKLKVGAEFNSCFAPVSHTALDVIVVDEGRKDDDTQKAVKAFCQVANDAGVAVLLAKKPKATGGSELGDADQST